MNILVAGGTGFVGRSLVKRLQAQGHTCFVLTRHPARAQKRAVLPDVPMVGLHESLPPVDAVVNLAGETVAGLWTTSKKAAILNSRVDTTRRLVALMERLQPRPQVFASASAIGFYGHRPGEVLTETSSPSPTRSFLSDVCRQWESEARAADRLGIRTVILRLGHVLHPSGGYLARLMPPFRLGICIGLGDPRQHVPWASLDDVVDAFIWGLNQPRVRGPANVVAPVIVTAQDLAEGLAQALHRRMLGFIPPRLLRLGLGAFANAIMEDQSVRPQTLLDSGFSFHDPDLQIYLKRCIAKGE